MTEPLAREETGDDRRPDRGDVFVGIDEALSEFGGRSLVSGTEVVDLLLDLRSTLAQALKLELVPAPLGS